MFEIGNSLREARVRRHIDLVEAEDDTKIRSKYLSAMETEDFDVLPGPVYTRGFLRTYARYLGLEAHLYIDEYNSRFGQFEDAAQEAAIRRHGSSPLERRGILNLRGAAIVSLLLLAALAWLGLHADSGGGGDIEAQQRESRNFASPSNDVGTFSDRHPAGSDTASRKPHTVSPVPPRDFAISAAGGSSWLEVRAGSKDGPVRFSGTLAEGVTRHFNGKRLYVIVGYPAATTLRVAKQRLKPDATAATTYVVTPTAIKPAQ